MNQDRRKFLKVGTGAAGAMVLMNPISKAVAAACHITPPQTPGPFYPGEMQFHTDSDLTQIPGHSTRALGQIIYIKGKVVDQTCQPIEGANVEIWQACASGKYNNPKDPNPAPLDPHFKYWAEVYTDAQGAYSFKTIIPGAYPADTDWIRPPHIHFKISRLGYKELITQMYFKGDPLNEKDLILQQIPAAERDRVVIDFQPTREGSESGTLEGEFAITLIKIIGN